MMNSFAERSHESACPRVSSNPSGNEHAGAIRCLIILALAGALLGGVRLRCRGRCGQLHSQQEVYRGEG
jgi:hypothetical protein